MGERLATFLRVLAWILCVLMLFGMVSCLFNRQFLSGLFYAAIALCAAPAVWDNVRERGVTVPVWARWIAGFVFLTFAVFTYSGPATPSAVVADSEASASMDAAQVAMAPEQKNAEAKVLVTRLRQSGGKCEGYGRNLAASETLNMTKTRQQFEAGKAVCAEAAAEVRKIAVPGYVSDSHRREMAAALENVAAAYEDKSEAFATFEEEGGTRDTIVAVIGPAVQRAHADLSYSLRRIKLLSYDEGVDSAAFAE